MKKLKRWIGYISFFCQKWCGLQGTVKNTLNEKSSSFIIVLIACWKWANEKTGFWVVMNGEVYKMGTQQHF